MNNSVYSCDDTAWSACLFAALVTQLLFGDWCGNLLPHLRLHLNSWSDIGWCHAGLCLTSDYHWCWIPTGLNHRWEFEKGNRVHFIIMCVCYVFCGLVLVMFCVWCLDKVIDFLQSYHLTFSWVLSPSWGCFWCFSSFYGVFSSSALLTFWVEFATVFMVGGSVVTRGWHLCALNTSLACIFG